MIHVNALTKRFGRAIAVNGVSLEIPAGDAVALWGINGAGKTTIIRCVLGLLRFDGTVTVSGIDVLRRGKHARRLIGYVPQELGFHDDLRAGEAIRFFARLKGLRRTDVAAVLASVHLDGQDRKRIRELSGGMKQRLALAIALLGDPPILVLDEVTASLDACGRDEFVALLAKLSGTGRTLLFASHRVDEVTTLARRVVTLEAGEVTAIHSTDRFAETLGSGAYLRFHLPPAARPTAMATLRAGGFSPLLNGVGVLVEVPRAQKAAPFRLLAEARISVDDFELISARDAHAQPEVSP